MDIAVVGLGLIGGSFCRAIKKKTEHRCWGLDIDRSVVSEAMCAGAIDGAVDTDGLGRADLTILCLHPAGVISFLGEHAQAFRPGSMVMDACGVKAEIMKAAGEAPFRDGVCFVGAHPMAGREFSGFAHSTPELFSGASLICTPTPETPTERIAALRTFSEQLGFSRLVETTPERHDRIIAFTSQLAHVVSSSYVKSPTLPLRKGFSAGSFQDLTRVARLDENMWTELFLMNREPLLSEIDHLIARLSEYRESIADGDAARLRSLLRDGRLLKEEDGR